MIKPYEHQQKSINEILEKFQTNQRVLYQLPTGGGKTFVFSFLTKLWVEKTNKKVLILCHREPLINQTVKSLNEIGENAVEILGYIPLNPSLELRLKSNYAVIDSVKLFEEEPKVSFTLSPDLYAVLLVEILKSCLSASVLSLLLKSIVLATSLTT